MHRLDSRLLQHEVAETIGVTEGTLWNWENRKAEPVLRWLPNILRFLGYDPRPGPTTIGHTLKRFRQGRGITQKAVACRLDVDPSTLARWNTNSEFLPETS